MNGIEKTDKRVRLLMITATVIIIILILVIIKVASNPKRITATKSGFALDTVVNITLYNKGDASDAEELLKLCSRYEDLIFSPTKDNSELYRINHTVWTPEELSSNSTKIIDLSEDMYNAMNQALKYYDITEGRYNIAVRPITELWDFHNPDKAMLPDPLELKTATGNFGRYGEDYVIATDYSFSDKDGIMRRYEYALILNRPVTFDLGSVAKGYIADQIRDAAYSKGLESLLIDLGGNICCGELKKGLSGSEPGFTIGIDTSFLPDTSAPQTVFAKPGRCVVTSGKYMRCFDIDGRHYHHILDAVTGYPVDTELASVTVIGPSSCACDALSTVCFLLGEQESSDLLSKEGCEAIFIYDDGTIHRR